MYRIIIRKKGYKIVVLVFNNLFKRVGLITLYLLVQSAIFCDLTIVTSLCYGVLCSNALVYLLQILVSRTGEWQP